MRPVVVDTNIVFPSLLKDDSAFTEVTISRSRNFFINELVITELFRHKEKITRLSQLEDHDVVHLFYQLIRELNLFKAEFLSPQTRREAYRLCKDIDATDSPHVAVTLELDGLLWTGDKRLRSGLQEQGFDRFFEPADL